MKSKEEIIKKIDKWVNKINSECMLCSSCKGNFNKVLGLLWVLDDKEKMDKVIKLVKERLNKIEEKINY